MLQICLYTNSVSMSDKAFLLTPKEQEVVNDPRFLIIPYERHELLSDVMAKLTKNKKNRIRFINYYIVKHQPANSTKQSEVGLLADDYNTSIVANLQGVAKTMHELTVTNTGEKKHKLAAGYFGGMFTQALINEGTEDEPKWFIFPNVIVNVITTGFRVKTANDGPKRILINVRNNENGFDKFKPFISRYENKDVSIDNLMFNKFTEIIQEELIASLKEIETLYSKLGKSKIKLGGSGIISSNIFNPKRLNYEHASSLLKKVMTIVKKTADEITFEQEDCKSPDEYYSQIRIDISGLTDEKYWLECAKRDPHYAGISVPNVRVVAPTNDVHYRFVNTPLLNKHTKSILNIRSLFTLDHRPVFGEAPKPGEYNVYSYMRADKNLKGLAHPAYTGFASCRTQVVNMCVSLKIFIGPSDFTPTLSCTPYTPLYVTRLDNDVFSKSTRLDYEEFDDISYETGSIKPIVKRAPKVIESSSDEESDGDDIKELIA